MKESILVSQIIQWAHYQPDIYMFRHNNVGGKLEHGGYVKPSRKGVSDLILCMGPAGRFIGIECKSDKGRLKPEQEDFRDKILALGGIFILAKSLDDVARHIEALRNPDFIDADIAFKRIEAVEAMQPV